MKSIGPALAVFCIAAVYIAVLYFRHKRYEAKLSLLRSAIERGQALDVEVVNKLMQPQAIPAKNSLPPGIGLRIVGIIFLAVGFGLPVMGYFLSTIDPKAFPALKGTGGLLICISIGMFAAAALAHNKTKTDQSA